MSRLFVKTLSAFGFQRVYCETELTDPTNEQELFAIDFNVSQPITWESYITKYNEIKHKEGLKLLRRKRDQLLKDTDWIMTFDVISTIENLDEWKAYRQALRDLPNNITIIWKSNNEDLDYTAMNFPSIPSIIKK